MEFFFLLFMKLTQHSKKKQKCMKIKVFFRGWGRWWYDGAKDEFLVLRVWCFSLFFFFIYFFNSIRLWRIQSKILWILSIQCCGCVERVCTLQVSQKWIFLVLDGFYLPKIGFGLWITPNFYVFFFLRMLPFPSQSLLRSPLWMGPF